MENYMEDWIGIEAAANYLDVTKDTINCPLCQGHFELV